MRAHGRCAVVKHPAKRSLLPFLYARFSSSRVGFAHTVVSSLRLETLGVGQRQFQQSLGSVHVRGVASLISQLSFHCLHTLDCAAQGRGAARWPHRVSPHAPPNLSGKSAWLFSPPPRNAQFFSALNPNLKREFDRGEVGCRADRSQRFPSFRL